MDSIKFERYIPNPSGKPYFELMNNKKTQKMITSVARSIRRGTRFRNARSPITGHVHKFKPGDATVEVTCKSGGKRAHAYAAVRMKNPTSHREMYHIRGLKKMARDALLASFERECDKRGFDRHEQ